MQSQEAQSQEPQEEEAPVVYRTHMAGNRVVRCEMPPIEDFSATSFQDTTVITLETLPMMEFHCSSKKSAYELIQTLHKYTDTRKGHKVEMSSERRGEWGDYVERHYVTVHADVENLKHIQAYFRLVHDQLPKVVI